MISPCFVLGIKIIGGRNEEIDKDFGIFVNKIVPDGLADRDGEWLQSLQDTSCIY